MIPQEKAAAVSKALHDAFGVTGFTGICRMTKGTSPLVFRIVVQDQPYLLKFITRTSDPARKVACMRAAANAGLAPRVRYTSVEDRIAITDFVNTVPFPRRDALVRIPAILRALHALPPFAGVPDRLNTSCMFLLNQGLADGFLRSFQASNILPQTDCDELLARHAQVAAVYPRNDEDMVSSHNDLFKPDNMLFDGQRVWLVDWEAAFLNDRYADLAVVANQLVSTEEEERLYLQEYFEAPPNEYQMARCFLMRQLTHMFYAMAFLLQGSPEKPLEASAAAPDFEDFQRRFWTGEITLTDREAKAQYGRFHWEQLRRNMHASRFDEALRVVSNR